MPAMRSAPFKNVRLVIWDLDETFWHGTLTEGGIRYNTEHHDIVVELCRRGIMNSICSRNERTAVEEILVGTEIWEYFIFPSIDWSPKADRSPKSSKRYSFAPKLLYLSTTTRPIWRRQRPLFPGCRLPIPVRFATF
jgi:predicted enzyme involved in methoxymalonyl-ACP biosynthesis